MHQIKFGYELNQWTKFELQIPARYEGKLGKGKIFLPRQSHWGKQCALW